MPPLHRHTKGHVHSRPNYKLQPGSVCATRSTETAVYCHQGGTPEWYCWLTTLNRTTLSQRGTRGNARSPISNHGHVFGRDRGTHKDTQTGQTYLWLWKGRLKQTRAEQRDGVQQSLVHKERRRWKQGNSVCSFYMSQFVFHCVSLMRYVRQKQAETELSDRTRDSVHA